MVNHALSKPDQEVSLISTFQDLYNSTIIDTMPMKFYPRSNCGIVLTNKDANGTVVKFMLQGITIGVTIRTTINE